MVSSYFTTFPA